MANGDLAPRERNNQELTGQIKTRSEIKNGELRLMHALGKKDSSQIIVEQKINIENEEEEEEDVRIELSPLSKREWREGEIIQTHYSLTKGNVLGFALVLVSREGRGIEVGRANERTFFMPLKVTNKIPSGDYNMMVMGVGRDGNPNQRWMSNPVTFTIIGASQVVVPPSDDGGRDDSRGGSSGRVNQSVSQTGSTINIYNDGRKSGTKSSSDEEREKKRAVGQARFDLIISGKDNVIDKDDVHPLDLSNKELGYFQIKNGGSGGILGWEAFVTRAEGQNIINLSPQRGNLKVGDINNVEVIVNRQLITQITERGGKIYPIYITIMAKLGKSTGLNRALTKKAITKTRILIKV